MSNNRIFDAKEYKDMKELLYGSAEKFGDRTAFTIKHQEGKKVEYDNKSYKEFSILNDEYGKPYLSNPPLENVHISISHCENYAVAFVIYE